MLQLSCFKLLKITTGNNFCFLTACKTVVFPLKLVFQGLFCSTFFHKDKQCSAVVVYTEGLMYVTTLKENYYTDITFEFTPQTIA